MEKQIVYITMLEGTTNYVPCRALKNLEDTFIILENEDIDLDEDATCIWQFLPGDIVRCKLVKECFFEFGGGVLIPVSQDESVGCVEKEILLATELIDSSFPKRKLYSLLFAIVKSLGNLDPVQVEHYRDEILVLCADMHVVQRHHPIVSRWIRANCIKP